MIRKTLASPPVSTQVLRRQRAILSALVAHAMCAYAAFATLLAFLAAPMLRAVEGGVWLTIGFLFAGLLGSYTLIGGALCGAIIGQLRLWPPPRPKCSFDGRRFVWTWPWAAARVLTQLGLFEVGRG